MFSCVLKGSRYHGGHKLCTFSYRSFLHPYKTDTVNNLLTKRRKGGTVFLFQLPLLALNNLPIENYLQFFSPEINWSEGLNKMQMLYGHHQGFFHLDTAISTIPYYHFSFEQKIFAYAHPTSASRVILE